MSNVGVHDTESPTLPLVRRTVKDLLTQSEAWTQMSPEQRLEIAQNMVTLGEAIAGGSGGAVPSVATVLADSTASQDFAQSGAAAASSGVDAMTAAIRGVDFPGFVSGLIDGVFNAIVTASIQQMEAFAELLRNVAKSLDEYMKDNVSENQARDYLVEKYPDHMELDMMGEEPRVKPKQGAGEDALPDFFKDLGLDMPVDSLEEETPEQVLMPAARKRMALDRQQLLATMVLMGINRIVVTDGSIQASVIFDLDTKDSVTKSRSVATQYERQTKSRPGFFGWFAPRYSTTTSEFKVQTASTEGSTADVELRAKLAGNVNVRFKSETFPLDRMADIIQPKEPAPATVAAPAPTAPVG